MAWPLKTRTRLYLFACARIPQRILGKVPSGIYRIRVRADSGFFDHKFIEPLDEESISYVIVAKMTRPIINKMGESSLLPVQEKLGSSRVFLQPFPVEETSSFCSNPPPPPRERFRTTDAFHPEALHLSGLCNQSPSQSRRDLVFLSAKGIDRSHYPGAERKLCLGQDSNQQFPGQPVLFSSPAIRLQSRQLVQETLPTSKISEGNLRDHSDRIFSPPGKIGQDATPESSQITQRVYLQTDPGSYHPEYQKNETVINFNQLVIIF